MIRLIKLCIIVIPDNKFINLAIIDYILFILVFQLRFPHSAFCRSVLIVLLLLANAKVCLVPLNSLLFTNKGIHHGTVGGVKNVLGDSSP